MTIIKAKFIKKYWFNIVKKSSDFNQKAPQKRKRAAITAHFLPESLT